MNINKYSGYLCKSMEAFWNISVKIYALVSVLFSGDICYNNSFKNSNFQFYQISFLISDSHFISCSSYEVLTWILLSTCIISLLAFFILLGLYYRRTTSPHPHPQFYPNSHPQLHPNPQSHAPSHTVFSLTNPQPKPSRWRDSVMDYRI